MAATLKASGLDMRLRMKKGVVDHECEPACALHQLEEQGGGATGEATLYGHDRMAVSRQQRPGRSQLAQSGRRLPLALVCAGQVKGDPGRDADAPQFAGAEGQGRASARGFASMARRGLHSSASWGQGEHGGDYAYWWLLVAGTAQQTAQLATPPPFDPCLSATPLACCRWRGRGARAHAGR